MGGPISTGNGHTQHWLRLLDKSSDMIQWQRHLP